MQTNWTYTLQWPFICSRKLDSWLVSEWAGFNVSVNTV